MILSTVLWIWLAVSSMTTSWYTWRRWEMRKNYSFLVFKSGKPVMKYTEMGSWDGLRDDLMTSMARSVINLVSPLVWHEAGLPHDDVIKWKYFPRNWPFVRGIQFPAQRPVTRSFGVSLICVWINDWVNNREAGDLRRHRVHYDVIVMMRIVLAWLERHKRKWYFLMCRPSHALAMCSGVLINGALL